MKSADRLNDQSMTNSMKTRDPLEGEEVPSRKRKAHSKSRLGCRNCKLRRVKCDEKKPECRKCIDFGVICNYGPDVPDLEPRAGAREVGCINDATIEKSTLSGNGPILETINASLQMDTSPAMSSIYARGQFDYSDLARMHRFQTRTVLSLGTRGTCYHFQKEIVEVACQHRFVMHIIQTITMAQDRHLMGLATSKRSPTELYHMTQGVSALQHKLSNPVRDEDRDALIVAATLLGVITFALLEASSIEEIWPLGDGDFNWLNLSDGKKAVWKLANPLRTGSVFRALGHLYSRNHIEDIEARERRPCVFDHLCEDDPDGAEDILAPARVNPYRRTVRYMATVLHLDCDDSTWFKFLAFIGYVDPGFKALLEMKDPWAMLMLAYWFAKICRGRWWNSARAILQGQAICLYLERHHAYDARLQEAIRYPKEELHLAEREGWGGFCSANTT
ncbi:hypothetical protein ABEF95_000923 [Exophiala dermatitidis]